MELIFEVNIISSKKKKLFTKNVKCSDVQKEVCMALNNLTNDCSTVEVKVKMPNSYMVVSISKWCCFNGTWEEVEHDGCIEFFNEWEDEA